MGKRFFIILLIICIPICLLVNYILFSAEQSYLSTSLKQLHGSGKKPKNKPLFSLSDSKEHNRTVKKGMVAVPPPQESTLPESTIINDGSFTRTSNEISTPSQNKTLFPVQSKPVSASLNSTQKKTGPLFVPGIPPSIFFLYIH